MNFVLLALLGVGAFAVVRARQPGATGGNGGVGGAGGIPAGDFTVLCPSRIPGLPDHAPASTAFGDWTEPCDSQMIVNTPPVPFYEGCGPRGCHVLPDGTALYQYTLDGTTSASVKQAVDATGVGPGGTVFKQTYFAGVPLDYPPLRATGAPFYNLAAATGGFGAPAGAAALSITNSAAPYAWRRSTATVGGSIPFEHDLKAIDDILPAGLPAVTWMPVDPSLKPITYKKAWAPDLSDFVNNIGNYACTALSTGLKVATYIEPTGVGKTIAGALAKNETTINYFQKLCGGK